MLLSESARERFENARAVDETQVEPMANDSRPPENDFVLRENADDYEGTLRNVACSRPETR
jgi:hypothetical protein